MGQLWYMTSAEQQAWTRMVGKARSFVDWQIRLSMNRYAQAWPTDACLWAHSQTLL